MNNDMISNITNFTSKIDSSSLLLGLGMGLGLGLIMSSLLIDKALNNIDNQIKDKSETKNNIEIVSNNKSDIKTVNDFTKSNEIILYDCLVATVCDIKDPEGLADPQYIPVKEGLINSILRIKANCSQGEAEYKQNVVLLAQSIKSVEREW